MSRGPFKVNRRAIVSIRTHDQRKDGGVISFRSKVKVPINVPSFVPTESEAVIPVVSSSVQWPIRDAEVLLLVRPSSQRTVMEAVTVTKNLCRVHYYSFTQRVLAGGVSVKTRLSKQTVRYKKNHTDINRTHDSDIASKMSFAVWASQNEKSREPSSG